MSDGLRDTRWLPERTDRDPDRVAVLIPGGGGHSPDRPSVPAIWLTPLLDQPWLVAELRRATAPTLLVGGTADTMWSPAIARDLPHPWLELDGADHSLETDEDPVHSAELLTRVTARMDAFVAAL